MATKKKPKLVDVAAIGRLGGIAHAAKLTPEQRSENARRAVVARWAKRDAAAKKGAK
jgi:hypothetical protein